MFEADAKRLIVDIVLSGFISRCYQNLVLSTVKGSVISSVKKVFKIVLKVVLLAPLLSLLHSLDHIFQVGVEDEAENLSLSCFRDLVLFRCDTTIKFIVKNSQISIILKYGVAGRL